MTFTNVYENERRARAYDQLRFGGTYLLAFRPLPRLFEWFVTGRRALDFGCGTGRTGRFLRELGFEMVGIDISREMVAVARQRDPGGDYRAISDGDFSSLPLGSFDLVLSAFTFDNIPGREHRQRLFSGLAELLAAGGRLVNIVSTPEIYTHEWVTFSTRAYPENRGARSGDIVRIVTTDYDDARPVDDVLWSDHDYRSLAREAGLEVLAYLRPLARGDEGIAWVSERSVPPWAIYVLGATGYPPS